MDMNIQDRLQGFFADGHFLFCHWIFGEIQLTVTVKYCFAIVPVASWTLTHIS